MIDLHCHILAGVDDGPRTLDQSIAMARAAVAGGIRTVVATPHVDARYGPGPGLIESAVAELNEALAGEGLDLTVLPGAEVSLDRAAELDAITLSRLCLGDSRALLLHCPLEGGAMLDEVLFDLELKNLRPVLAHPERSRAFQRRPEAVRALVDRGVVILATAGSIAGRHGESAQHAARDLLSAGLVHAICSDAHDVFLRPPVMAPGPTGLSAAMPGLARSLPLLTESAPAAILSDQPLPRPPRVRAGRAAVRRGRRRAPPHWTAIASRARRRGPAMLVYHGVERVAREHDPDFLCIEPDRFRGHLELLLDAGWQFVTVDELVRRSASGRPSDGVIAISFDDGLANNRFVALPILSELEIPATVYVTTGLIGKPYPWVDRAAGLRLMSEHEIAELARAGIEIGAHSVTHPDLSKCSYERCLREMVESRRTLERVIGGEVTTFAYPYAMYSRASARAARDAGFLAAVTYTKLARGTNRYALGRELVTAKDGLPSLAMKLLGTYDPMFDSVTGRSFRAVSRPLRRQLNRLRG